MKFSFFFSSKQVAHFFFSSSISMRSLWASNTISSYCAWFSINFLSNYYTYFSIYLSILYFKKLPQNPVFCLNFLTIWILLFFCNPSILISVLGINAELFWLKMQWGVVRYMTLDPRKKMNGTVDMNLGHSFLFMDGSSWIFTFLKCSNICWPILESHGNHIYTACFFILKRYIYCMLNEQNWSTALLM